VSETLTQPTLGDALLGLGTRTGEEIRVCIPGTIQLLGVGGRVAVQPAVLKWRGEELFAEPVLLDVPLLFPGTSRCVTQYPVLKGDAVLIIVSDRDLSAWKGTRGLGLPTAPESKRTHSLSDAVAIPIAFGGGAPVVELLTLVKAAVQALATSITTAPGNPISCAPQLLALVAQLTAAGVP
jgi:hypothetical protein